MGNDTEDNAPNAIAPAVLAELIEKATLAATTAALAQIAAVNRQQDPAHRIRLTDMAAEALERNYSSSKRTYKSYVDLLTQGWAGHRDVFAGLGDMWADEILPKHLETALHAVEMKAAARVAKRNTVREDVGRHTRHVGGPSAKYNAVGAWRWLFKYAEDNRHIPTGTSPARSLKKPKRIEGTRMAFTDEQLGQVWAVASQTGDDPELDALLLETILISGARREGLINLTIGYLDPDECVLWLDEKFGKITPQPVPDWFFDKVTAFAASRGATSSGDKVFRKRAADGQTADITGRRFDYLFTTRVQSSYAWADKEKVGAHTVRHHAITLIERSAGRAVARMFARHSADDVTAIYTKASQAEVAKAVVGLYGGDHPWLHREPRVKPRE